MDKSSKVTLFSTITLIGFAFGVIYHYILAFYAHKTGVYESFLYPKELAFCDFFHVLPSIKDLKPYQEISMWVVYFPITYLFLLPFAFIKNKILAYLIYISGFLVYLVTMNIKMFSCEKLTKLQNVQNIFILTFLSYPVLYCLDKGNFDMYLFVLLGFWTFAFQKEKYKLSAVLLALINAIKPFTIYFLLLYLMKKRYKECVLSILLTAFLIIIGFLIIHDNLVMELSTFILSVRLYKYTYTHGANMGMGFLSSLYMPLKVFFLHFTTSVKNVGTFNFIYDIFCQIITIITLIFVWREKTFWKQLTLLICNFLLLPYCTYDYKLIFLLIPIWLFINQKEKTKFDFHYLILFAFLLIPKNIIIEFPYIHNGLTNWLSLSAIINPIIMILLSLLIIQEQIIERTGNRKEGRED